jgi:hypothetical protein
MCVWAVNISLQDYTVSKAKRLLSEQSQPWRPQNLYNPLHKCNWKAWTNFGQEFYIAKQSIVWLENKIFLCFGDSLCLRLQEKYRRSLFCWTELIHQFFGIFCFCIIIDVSEWLKFYKHVLKYLTVQKKGTVQYRIFWK